MAMTRAPYHTTLYSSISLICDGATSSIDLFNPAFARTLRPGCSIVPAALAVMFRTFKSSTTMTLRLLAITVVALCAASFRRRLELLGIGITEAVTVSAPAKLRITGATLKEVPERLLEVDDSLLQRMVRHVPQP
jgi:hypothetical protein